MNLRASLLALAALSALLFAAEEDSLDTPATSSRAKSYRKKGEKAWDSAYGVVATLESGKELPPADQMRKAMLDLEEAAKQFDRSLHADWDAATNDQLIEVVKAWYALRGKIPEEALPEDPKERQKIEKKREKARKARVREARRILLKALALHRHDKQVLNCDRCGGVGEGRTAFGEKYKCPKCKGIGRSRSRDGIIEAHLLPYSPLWRADPRNKMSVTRMIRSAARSPERLAPFVQSVRVKGNVEDHDFWVRIHVREKHYTNPRDKRTQTVDKTYILYRVGKIWWVHGGRHDRELFELPKEVE